MIQSIFTKQKIMRRVVYSLAPIFLFSIYLYGWRSPLLVGVSVSVAIIAEYIVEKRRGKKVSEAVLITSMLYGMSLPPATPVWIAIVGILFGVLVGKELFGGFGRNIFNPAIVGRLFIYITFPTRLGSAWLTPGNFGALAQSGGVDAITAATPLALIGVDNGAAIPDLMGRIFGGSFSVPVNMLLGFRAGSLGESAIVLIVLAGLYLIFTKTAQWRLIVSTLGAAVILISAFYFSGLTTAFRPDIALMSGSLLYVTVFMCTDPVTAPNKPASQWVYGALIGSVAVIIRSFSGFPEGTSFAVMMGNVFSSLLDEIMPKAKKKKKTIRTPIKEAIAHGA